jgi:hypothetical protein
MRIERRDQDEGRKRKMGRWILWRGRRIDQKKKRRGEYK